MAANDVWVFAVGCAVGLAALAAGVLAAVDVLPAGGLDGLIVARVLVIVAAISTGIGVYPLYTGRLQLRSAKAAARVVCRKCGKPPVVTMHFCAFCGEVYGGADGRPRRA